MAAVLAAVFAYAWPVLAQEPDNGARQCAVSLAEQSPERGVQYFNGYSLDRKGGDGVDYYTFSTDGRYQLGLGVRGQSIDLLAHLEDADGNEVAVSGPPKDPSKDQSIEWLLATIAAGTYYIRVEAQEDGETDYYLRFGLEATLAHYNREGSFDGQWYVFIIDEDDLIIGHPDADRIGLDVKGWVGTDANGYSFGPEMLSAGEDGKWVSYVYKNPEDRRPGTDDFELKNVWAVRHDGLIFASGWYIDADEFTRQLVSVAVERFRTGGLEATVVYFASPGSALAGLESAIDYYNEAETIDGRWAACIADASGNIVAHSDPARIGMSLDDLFGAGTIDAAGLGSWVTTDTVRM